MTLRGAKARPRTVLLGPWSSERRADFSRLFPTVHEYKNQVALERALIQEEVDLILCDSQADVSTSWAASAHTIVFGPNMAYVLPSSDFPARSLRAEAGCRSQEHHLTDLPAILDAPRKHWLEAFDDPRGLLVISQVYKVASTAHASSWADDGSSLQEMALIMACQPDRPLAIQYFRDDAKRGFAWFPSPVPNEVEWVRALLALWAERDPEGLPGFRDWDTQREWMVNVEIALEEELSALAVERVSTLARFDAREAELRTKLLVERQAATAGIRLLLTSQGHDLDEAVSLVFRDLGFEVEAVDASIPKGEPRREDLRLRAADREGWEAIVEVKGYGGSGGKMKDIHQLQYHASMYAAKHGKQPSQQIYVINGEIDSVPSPALRRCSIRGEDLDSFSATDGLVLPTPDLFRLHRDRSTIGLANARRLIADSRALFIYPK